MTEIELKALLRERGMRVTPQRVLIHSTLLELERHATAEQVLERVAQRLPNASLPTVYSALELFEQLGLVRRVATAGGAAVWDARTDGHPHFVCDRCACVEDVEAPLDATPAMKVARDLGMVPRAAELVLTGLCPKCASAVGLDRN